MPTKKKVTYKKKKPSKRKRPGKDVIRAARISSGGVKKKKTPKRKPRTQRV